MVFFRKCGITWGSAAFHGSFDGPFHRPRFGCRFFAAFDRFFAAFGRFYTTCSRFFTTCSGFFTTRRGFFTACRGFFTAHRCFATLRGAYLWNRSLGISGVWSRDTRVLTFDTRQHWVFGWARYWTGFDAFGGWGLA